MYELLNIQVKDGKQLLSARELHKKLKVQQDFSDWIKKQLELVDAEENLDYTTLPFKKERQILIEYVLTLDIAKEICMIVGASPRTNAETKDLSKHIRKYFIQCEKLTKQLSMYYDEKLITITNRLDHTEKLIGIRSKTVFEYGKYIKNKMGIKKANGDYQNVKMVLFAELGVHKWEDIDYSLEVIEKIDEILSVMKLDRQLSIVS